MKLLVLLFLLSFATPTPMMGGDLATPDWGRWCEGKRRSLGLLLLVPPRAGGNVCSSCCSPVPVPAVPCLFPAVLVGQQPNLGFQSDGVVTGVIFPLPWPKQALVLEAIFLVGQTVTTWGGKVGTLTKAAPWHPSYFSLYQNGQTSVLFKPRLQLLWNTLVLFS